MIGQVGIIDFNYSHLKYGQGIFVRRAIRYLDARNEELVLQQRNSIPIKRQASTVPAIIRRKVNHILVDRGADLRAASIQYKKSIKHALRIKARVGRENRLPVLVRKKHIYLKYDGNSEDMKVLATVNGIIFLVYLILMFFTI